MKTYLLDNDSINSIIDHLNEYLSIENIDKKSISVIKLIVEDILLFYQSVLTPDACLKYSFSRIDHNNSLTFRIAGEKTDIQTGDRNEELPLLFKLWKKLNGTMTYAYENGENVITIKLLDRITFRGNIAFAWELAKTNKKDFFIGLLYQIISTVLCIIVPIYSVKIITGLSMPVTGELFTVTAIVVLMRLVNALVSNTSRIHLARVFQDALYVLQTKLAEAVLTTQQSSLNERGTSYFLQRLNGDARSVATGLNDFVINIMDFIYYLGIAISILMLSPLAFLVSMTNVAMLYLVNLRRGATLITLSKKLRRDEEQLTGVINAIVQGNEEIRLQNNHSYFINLLGERIRQRNVSALEKKVRITRFTLISKCIAFLSQFIYVSVLALLLKNGKVDFASAIALYNFHTIINNFMVSSLNTFLDSVKEYNISCERVGMLLTSPYFPKEQFGDCHLDRIVGNIRFENVSFAYNHENLLESDRLVLQNMNLYIEAGKTTAIVGRSGYGKTTMINLITRLRDVSDGRITLDGVDVRKLDRTTLRDGIAVVSQNTYYFNMTIRENITAVRPGLSDEKMMEIFDRVQLGDMIRNLPEGLDTNIGERGVRLSGGQRQRLAIARVIAKDSPIIIFDEATSALDNITQHQIQDTISSLSGEHTVIVIAHRLSTVRDADKIAYIDCGKVMAEGTHEELWVKCLPYRELYEAEAAREDKSE